MYTKYIGTYQRFQWINDTRVDDILNYYLKPESLGRKGYGQLLLFKWLIVKQLHNCSYRDLESLSGIDYSTFIKFKNRLKKNNWFEKVFNKLTTIIGKVLSSLSCLQDSSFVETYSKRKEQGAEYNGHKEKIGFKLHQILDYATRLPLRQTLTAGARSDVRVGTKLINKVSKYWKVKEWLADKAYDAGYVIDQLRWKWKGIKIGIPVRRTSQEARGSKTRLTKEQEALKAKERTLDQKFLNKRTEIERYFSRKKRVFNLGKERTRGLNNFKTHCFLTSIMEILEWLTKPFWVIIHHTLYCLCTNNP